MKDDLAKYGVSVVALSKDTVEQAANNKKRDGLTFTLLSDPELAVIKQYGVEHHKALEFSKGGFTLFGIPLALVPSVKRMAIPTSLLLDEQGVIHWIDQSEDYRLRSNEQRVMEAIKAAFG